MKKIKKQLMRVRYFAYVDPNHVINAEPDAWGVVRVDDIVLNPSSWYYKYDADDNVVPRDGYIFVYDEDGRQLPGAYFVSVVTESAMFAEVAEEDRLDTGWGCDYPGGGKASCCEPNYVGEIDGEEVYLIKRCW